eukprot:7151699-Pyramimonas_sp.AAC.1
MSRVGEVHAVVAIWTTKRCTGWGDACGKCNWDLRWNFPNGYEMLYWVGETHADRATVAVSGAPYVATECFTGMGRRMRALAVGASEELPMGH